MNNTNSNSSTAWFIQNNETGQLLGWQGSSSSFSFSTEADAQVTIKLLGSKLNAKAVELPYTGEN